MTERELKPLENQHQKSFYGKAIIKTDNAGNETLYSYNTAILTRTNDGTIVKHWNDWSMTTGKHIKAFCGLSKKEYIKL